MIKEYVKKPVVVQAVQWTGDNEQEVFDFVGRKNLYLKGESPRELPKLYIKTLEGDHFAEIGDYIIKDIKGEFYPCKEDIFLDTYKTSKADKNACGGTLKFDDEFVHKGSRGYHIKGYSDDDENNSSFRYKSIMNRIVHWYDYSRYKCKHCLDYESDKDECYKRKTYNTKGGESKACNHFIISEVEESMYYEIAMKFYKRTHLCEPTRWHNKIGNMMFKKSIDTLLKEKEIGEIKW